jgi:TfoX/Sxy family transcriptional regulator of competence genes
MDYLLDQLSSAGPVSGRRMFGEYCLYYDGRPVGLVCDGQLFLKPTEPGLALMQEKTYGAPFPGAKPHLLVQPDLWEDKNWLGNLVRATAHALPPPKAPRVPKVTKKKPSLT